MTETQAAAVEALRRAGWAVALSPGTDQVPPAIRERYHWAPAEVWAWVEGLQTLVSPDETTWFLAQPDYAGTSGLAFAWNVWERMSLTWAARDQDTGWADRIRRFWDEHLPPANSVRGDYAYLALRRTDLSIVYSWEEFFEEPSPVARSTRELFEMLARRETGLREWSEDAPAQAR